MNEKVFEQLFNELYAPLCKYCIQFVHSEFTAEEIVQEQFISLWQKSTEIEIQSFKAYIYTSVKNKAIDHLRSKYAKMQFVDERMASDMCEESTFEEGELDEIITKAIKELPKKCAVIFSMKRYGNYSNKQISEELDISEKTVENQITIAFKKLRPVLVKYMQILVIIILFQFFLFPFRG